MKLAEALLLRAELQTKLVKLRERIGKAARVQEGDQPQEDAEKLLLEAMGVSTDLHTLIGRIHRTNHSTRLADSRTLADLTVERDRLRQQVALLSFAAEQAVTSPDSARYSMREIKWVPVLNVGKLHKQIDDVSSSLRTLNATLQEMNWKVLLAE